MNAIHFQVPTWFDVPGFLPMLDEIVQRERCRIYVSRAGFSQAAMVVPSDNPPGPASVTWLDRAEIPAEPMCYGLNVAVTDFVQIAIAEQFGLMPGYELDHRETFEAFFRSTKALEPTDLDRKAVLGDEAAIAALERLERRGPRRGFLPSEANVAAPPYHTKDIWDESERTNAGLRQLLADRIGPQEGAEMGALNAAADLVGRILRTAQAPEKETAPTPHAMFEAATKGVAGYSSLLHAVHSVAVAQDIGADLVPTGLHATIVGHLGAQLEVRSPWVTVRGMGSKTPTVEPTPTREERKAAFAYRLAAAGETKAIAERQEADRQRFKRAALATNAAGEAANALADRVMRHLPDLAPTAAAEVRATVVRATESMLFAEESQAVVDAMIEEMNMRGMRLVIPCTPECWDALPLDPKRHLKLIPLGPNPRPGGIIVQDPL